MKNYYIGVNYWDSKSGTDMWSHFDESVIEADLSALEKAGVSCLRIFPNWRDFQPVCKLYAWRGYFKEYRLTGDRFPENEYFIDPVMIERFLRFCDIAQKHGMELVVGVVTGWMSGRLFTPPALEGKNIISDPEALLWQTRFCRGFVSMVKHHSAIVAWELGNECNCLGTAASRAEAYNWTCAIRSAISLADPSRPVYSGMHGLESEEGGIWAIEDQSELTDLMTCHPYPSPTVGGDVGPADMMRTTIIPTAQLEYYSGISGKPAMIEEQGTFSDMLIRREGAAAFLRVNMMSGWANGSRGYFWWCGMEHLLLDQPPYSWSMIERQLGLLDLEREPKPVAREMKNTAAVLESLPQLPPKQMDAVCILPREIRHWPSAAACYILGKQAGLEITMRTSTQILRDSDLPKAEVYFVPTMTGWASLYKEAYQALLNRAQEGASVYFSISTGQLVDFEKHFGLSSYGMMNAGSETLKFGDSLELPMQYDKKFMLRSIGAEVLATDSQGNIVLARHACGKGWIYYLGFPMEQMLWNQPMAFSSAEDRDYARIYRIIGEKVLKSHPIQHTNRQVGMTLHPDGNGWYAVLVNYDNQMQDASITLNGNYSISTIYGRANAIEPCSMAVLRIDPEA